MINFAIALRTASGLLICLVIVALFLGDTLGLGVPADFIATLFVLAMLALIGSFVFLSKEIFIASKSLRLSRHIRH